MLSMLRKAALVGLLSVMSFSAFADIQCRVHNARGQYWIGAGATRAIALSNALRFCSGGSSYASNCKVDYCDGVAGAGSANWQCTMTNGRGQTWYGTGSTRALAASNAARFCSSHSTYARNCVIRGCSIR